MRNTNLIAEFSSEELREIADEYGADYLKDWLTTERVEFLNNRKVGNSVGKVKLYKDGTYRIIGRWYPEELSFLIKTLRIIKKETEF